MESTKIKMIFSIFGESLDNQMLNDIIGVNSTHNWKKDDVIPNRNNIKRKETCWEYQFDYIETLYVDDVTNAFLNIFQKSKNKLKKYIKLNKLEVKFFLVIEIFNNQVPSLFLPFNFISFAHYFKASIDIDLYII